MIINTKNRSTKYHSKDFHKSYGIQSWLCSKGYCLSKVTKNKVDKVEYKNLLKEYILHDNPNFDFSKLKHGLESMEKYVQNRFNKFATFTTNKFKQ